MRRTESPPPAAQPTYAELRAKVAALHGQGEARVTLIHAIADLLLPAWLGTKWAFHGTCEEPMGAQGIACGYFVATILQHAGLMLESRARFAQSTASRIARSLIPPGPSHHRIFSVPATTLESKMRSFGEGIYLIGLDVHVGFGIVTAKDVRFVHASYLGKRVVVNEPIVASEPIERSRDAGYHVTSLFGDDTLARAWSDRSVIRLAD